jgi:Sec-independent protein translocase protein TatA
MSAADLLNQMIQNQKVLIGEFKRQIAEDKRELENDEKQLAEAVQTMNEMNALLERLP